MIICAVGVNALVIVALKDSVDHQALEFGRGFSYIKPLSINMLNVGNALLEQLVSFFYYLINSNKEIILSTLKIKPEIMEQMNSLDCCKI